MGLAWRPALLLGLFCSGSALSPHMHNQLSVWQRLKLHNFSMHSILDVGANVGDWASIARRKIWPEASYFLVEANKAHRDRLRRTGLPFAIALLGNSRRNASYWVQAGRAASGTGNSIFPINFQPFKGEFRETTREMVPLDDLLQAHCPGQRFDVRQRTLLPSLVASSPPACTHAHDRWPYLRLSPERGHCA